MKASNFIESWSLPGRKRFCVPEGRVDSTPLGGYMRNARITGECLHYVTQFATGGLVELSIQLVLSLVRR